MPAPVVLALPPKSAGVAIPTMPCCNLHLVFYQAPKAQTSKVCAIHTKGPSSGPVVSAGVQNGIFVGHCAYPVSRCQLYSSQESTPSP